MLHTLYLETMECKTDCFRVVRFIVVDVDPISAGKILPIVEGVVVAPNHPLTLSPKESVVAVGSVGWKK